MSGFTPPSPREGLMSRSCAQWAVGANVQNGILASLAVCLTRDRSFDEALRIAADMRTAAASLGDVEATTLWAALMNEIGSSRVIANSPRNHLRASAALPRNDAAQ